MLGNAYETLYLVFYGSCSYFMVSAHNMVIVKVNGVMRQPILGWHMMKTIAEL